MSDFDPAIPYSRPSVPAMDGLLGQRLAVLDDGFVRPVDYMGSDSSIVQAARVSYGVGTKKISEDRGLIRYLMRHGHTTPFEMCELKLHVRTPMDTWRQWIRHRTASVNEYSTRYSIAIDNAQATSDNAWRQQSSVNRQGSGEFLPFGKGAELSAREQDFQRMARDVYNQRLSLGVAREQARKDLPLSTYTEAYWKIDLHNLFHFLELRLDAHAQYEIRQYATVIADQIVKRWCPLAWEAFVDYRLDTLRLSRVEAEIVKLLAANRKGIALEVMQKAGFIPRSDGSGDYPNRELRELEEKLKKLGFELPTP